MTDHWRLSTWGQGKTPVRQGPPYSCRLHVHHLRRHFKREPFKMFWWANAFVRKYLDSSGTNGGGGKQL